MTTITATQLRSNLDAIIQRAQAGEQFNVTHRSKPAFRILPQKAPAGHIKPGSPEAMQLFIERARKLRSQAMPGSEHQTKLQAGKDYKAIYWADMAKKYGIK